MATFQSKASLHEKGSSINSSSTSYDKTVSRSSTTSILKVLACCLVCTSLINLYIIEKASREVEKNDVSFYDVMKGRNILIEKENGDITGGVKEAMVEVPSLPINSASAMTNNTAKGQGDNFQHQGIVGTSIQDSFDDGLAYRVLDNSDNMDSIDKDTDGLLVLHIGPSKTGTSSLQCSLQTSPFLAKSSYRYVGRTERQCSPGRYPVQNAVVGDNDFNRLHAIAFNLVFMNSTKARDGMKKRLSMIQRNNHTTSAIISAEEFCAMPTRHESFWGTLHDAISPYKGKTRVVVTYRHLHEIMVSSYSENIIGRTTDRHWTDKGIISFPEYWANIKGKKHGIPMTSDLIASYEKHNFTNITVFNFHGDSDSDSDSGRPKNGDDLIVRFICDLPNAEEACEAYKNDSVVNGMDPAARSRPSHKAYAQYDRIAKAAHSKGMLCNYNLTALDRKSAASAIQDRVERQLGLKYTDLPLTCLDQEETEEALRLSIQDGRGVWKDTFNEDALRSAFQHYKEKKSFCAVDVDTVLSADAWSQFIMHKMNKDATLPATQNIF